MTTLMLLAGLIVVAGIVYVLVYRARRHEDCLTDKVNRRDRSRHRWEK